MAESVKEECLSCAHYQFDTERAEVFCELTKEAATAFGTCDRWSSLTEQLKKEPKDQLSLF